MPKGKRFTQEELDTIVSYLRSNTKIAKMAKMMNRSEVGVWRIIKVNNLHAAAAQKNTEFEKMMQDALAPKPTPEPILPAPDTATETIPEQPPAP